MGDKGLVERMLDALLNLLHHDGLVRLQLTQAVEVLLHELLMLVDLTAYVAHSGPVLIQVCLLVDHLQVSESVNCCFDCLLKACL